MLEGAGSDFLEAKLPDSSSWLGGDLHPVRPFGMQGGALRRQGPLGRVEPQHGRGRDRRRPERISPTSLAVALDRRARRGRGALDCRDSRRLTRPRIACGP